MRSKKSLAMRYYQLKYRHPPIAKSGGKSSGIVESGRGGKRAGKREGAGNANIRTVLPGDI